LCHSLELGERVEADVGNHGNPVKIKCPGNDMNLEENWGMQGRVMVWHEMLTGQLKNRGILSQVFHHHILLHGDVFRVCTVITQLTIENGEPLFEVEYEDS